MDNLFQFITDDWKKIPQNLRYLFISGVILIFNSWLLDHWGNNIIYKFWTLDIRSIGYNIGLTLILISLGLLVSKQFWSFGKLLWYRKKYSLEKLDEDFYLIWFNGKLYLFDNDKKNKKYYHVRPWETAQDLFFDGVGDQFPFGFDPVNNPSVPLGATGKVLDLKKYKNGGSLNTRI